MGFKILCNTINDLMSIVTAITCTHSYNHNAELNPVTSRPVIPVISLYTGSARHLETWNTPGYLFGIFQDLENLEK